MRILLVEDESELAIWLIKALEQSHFVVDWTNDGLVAEKTLGIEEFDAVILDLGLPGKNGHSVLNYLRTSGNHVPVMILTARDTLIERVSSLNEGADDFMPKPFALAELEARLQALIRRSRGREHSRLNCGSLTFDANTKVFQLENIPMALTPREHAMLIALIYRTGEPVSKQLLLDRVFAHNEDVNLEAIEVLVYRLRKKLAHSTVRIVTMRGLGYCLEGNDDRRELA